MAPKSRGQRNFTHIIKEYRCFGLILIFLVLFQILILHNSLHFDFDHDAAFQLEELEEKRAELTNQGKALLGVAHARKSKLKEFGARERTSTQHVHSPNESILSGNKAEVVFKNVRYLKRDYSSVTNFTAACTVSDATAQKALSKAKTHACRQELADVYCENKAKSLYPTSLESTCPLVDDKAGVYEGCYRDSRTDRMLSIDAGVHGDDTKKVTPTYCVQLCYKYGQRYAGAQYGRECWCGGAINRDSKTTDENCNLDCRGDKSKKCGGYLHNSVYRTSYNPMSKDIPRVESSMAGEPIRILFLLTVNGRAVRQVRRLIGSLYSPHHFYYIHVDQRLDYMHRELSKLRAQASNIRICPTRYKTMWGGATLLTALLSCMQQASETENWPWDYVLNLSESDYPLKTLKELEAYLTKNKGRNFVRSHGANTPRFVSKQGLEHLFVQCDGRMWRIGAQQFPLNMRVDGGSDWIVLYREFVDAILRRSNPVFQGLLQYYKYTLLPAESFFHTALINSEFCTTYTDNNLHMINWNRARGCKCQYKHIVDWCGCSPNVILTSNLGKLSREDKKATYFARKFDASIDLEVLNHLDERLFGSFNKELRAVHSYWLNEYHHLDDAAADFRREAYRALAQMSLPASGASSISRVLEATLLFTSSHEQGGKTDLHGAGSQLNSLLVLFEEGRSTLEAQLQFNPTETHYTEYAESVELKQFQVGEAVDSKELMFRNYARLLGPRSSIQVLVIIPHKFVEKLNLNIIVLDPSGAVMEKTALPPDRKQASEITCTPKLPKILRAGKWTVALTRDDSVLLAFTFITVLPDISMWNKHGAQLPQGAGSTITKIPDAMKQLQLDAQKRETKLRSSKPIEWAQLLMEQFESSDVCYVSGTPRQGMARCHLTWWSSKSPDPKSQFKDRVINYQRPIR